MPNAKTELVNPLSELIWLGIHLDAIGQQVAQAEIRLDRARQALAELLAKEGEHA